MGRVLSYESEKAVAYQRRTELEDIRIIGENMRDEDIKRGFPNTEHIHFYGMYLGNYPELKEEEIYEITRIINSI